jgi:23S rRNA (guanosine2251-2'-O)-methyltransferase
MERSKYRQDDLRRGKAGARASDGQRSRPSRLPAEQVLFGLHAVEAALSNPKRLTLRAYLTDNAAAKLGSLIAKRNVPVTAALPSDLDDIVGGGAVHQGAVLHVEPLAQPSLEDFLDSLPEDAPATLAILDQVTDPHNVGAVMRSAAAFGVAALIVQDRHSPPLTGALAKSASGALDHVPVISTVNLARALERLKERGFFCLGFDSEEAQRFHSSAADAPRAAFVFGAEGKGLRRLVREGCDAIYALSAPGPIKSLNISNAAAIVFYEAAIARSES